MPGNDSRQICFIDMPFGKKIDPHTGLEIDFDQIYQAGIEPAVTRAGLSCIRGDREKTGGIIHKAMFARLLMSEFVIADLTTANANVFYELGIRHTARPYTTIPIFATISSPPFDVNMVRSIPYELSKGLLDEEAAKALGNAIDERIKSALQGPVSHDSPLFQLFDDLPELRLSDELSDVFNDRIRASEDFEDQLSAALDDEPRNEAVARVKALQQQLGDLKTLDHEVLMRLYLAYRGKRAWQEMIGVHDEFPAALQDTVVVRQQLALALNRRNTAGDRKKAIRILDKLIEQHGESAETCGIFGRIYKDQYTTAKKAGDPRAPAYLDQAIDLYSRGFKAEPTDYFPGVNAINLLMQKGTEAAQKEADALTPLVAFAVTRMGGEQSSDYWTLASCLELAVIGRRYDEASAVLPRVLTAAEDNMMLETTINNLLLVEQLREGHEDVSPLKTIIAGMRTGSGTD